MRIFTKRIDGRPLPGFEVSLLLTSMEGSRLEFYGRQVLKNLEFSSHSN